MGGLILPHRSSNLVEWRFVIMSLDSDSLGLHVRLKSCNLMSEDKVVCLHTNGVIDRGRLPVSLSRVFPIGHWLWNVHWGWYCLVVRDLQWQRRGFSRDETSCCWWQSIHILCLWFSVLGWRIIWLWFSSWITSFHISLFFCWFLFSHVLQWVGGESF